MKLAVFSGPSGGHFYPALAFAEAFKKRYPQARILFVTGQRGHFLTPKAQGLGDAEFDFLPDFPFPGFKPVFLIRILPFLLKLIQAFRRCQKILDGFQPDLSIGFGSYIAFAGLWASRLRKIPTVIHEQNRKMGKANAWLTRLADRIAFSFEETLPNNPTNEKKMTLTGLPLRSSLVQRAAQNKRDSSHAGSTLPVRILLIGGSQGSHSLNFLWIKAVQSLSDEEKSKIAVTHITGEKDFAALKAMYLSKGMEATVFSFYESMEELYAKADLAITRAGASTLFELALFGLPAVVLPYPYAEGHQEANARYFEKEEAILVLSERGCTPEQLKGSVFSLVRSSERRNHLKQNIKRLAYPEAAEKLVDVTEELFLEKEACGV